MRWIRINKSLTEWKHYKDPMMLRLLIHLLLMADEDGELTTSYRALAKEMGVTLQRIRTMIDKLVKTQQITHSATQSATHLKICKSINYETPQHTKQHSGQHSEVKNTPFEQESTQSATHLATHLTQSESMSCKDEQHTQQHSDQHSEQGTERSKRKEAKEVQERINHPLKENTLRVSKKDSPAAPSDQRKEYAPNVSLTEKEYERLCRDYGKEDADGSIDFLASYKVEQSYTCKVDNLAIRRWVVNAYRRKKADDERYSPKPKAGNKNYRNEDFWK